jgi:hypothetical protein
MALFKRVILAALGYAGYRYFTRSRAEHRAAFADGQDAGDNFSQVRDAGPDAMASGQKTWSRVDEAVDESFPASDPPSTY